MPASLIDQFLDMFISVDPCPAAPFSGHEASHFSAILARIRRHLLNLLDMLPLVFGISVLPNYTKSGHVGHTNLPLQRVREPAPRALAEIRRGKRKISI
jgi:hypothetical protein